MASLSFAVVVLSAVLLVEAGGHGQGQQGGGMMARGGWQGQEQGGRMARGGGQEQGGWQGQQMMGSPKGRSNGGGWGQQDSDMQQGGMGRSRGNDNNRQFGDSSSGKYRTNLYNDDDVYGYDASYPNGQALYVNYRNTEARSRRGPEFARSNSISARSSGRSGQMQQGGRQQRGSMMGMGMEADAMMGHEQW